MGTGALSTSIQKEHAPWTSRGCGQTLHVCSQPLPKGRIIEKVLGACAGFSALPSAVLLSPTPAAALYFLPSPEISHFGELEQADGET